MASEKMVPDLAATRCRQLLVSPAPLPRAGRSLLAAAGLGAGARARAEAEAAREEACGAAEGVEAHVVGARGAPRDEALMPLAGRRDHHHQREGGEHARRPGPAA